MIDAELKIARFTDGVMLPDEKNAFLAEIHTDAELREALETENTILTAIGTDAAAIEHTMMFDTAPGAPLVERLAATAVSSRKIVYYLIGAAAILTLVAL